MPALWNAKFPSRGKPRGALRRIASIVALLLTAAAVPGLGQDFDSAEDGALKPGQFVWTPQLSPDGPMTVIVSLSDQRAYIYRNGIRIGVSTISSGKPGYETPTGVFTILEKSVKHRSNRYSSAPMPYMERLTWDGIALHAGKLPGFAASHGCVRLPLAFSKALFEETSIGTTVFVTDGQPDLQTVIDSGLSLDPGATPVPAVVAAPAATPAPTSAAPSPASSDPSPTLPASSDGQPAASNPNPLTPDPSATPGAEFGWHPELAPTGPVTILVSYADQRMMVLRNGTIIGNARAQIPSHVFHGTAAFQMEGFDTTGKPIWLNIGKPKHDATDGKPVDRSTTGQLHVSPDFLAKVRELLAPGVTMVVTDDSFTAGNEGKPVTVFTD